MHKSWKPPLFLLLKISGFRKTFKKNKLLSGSIRNFFILLIIVIGFIFISLLAFGPRFRSYAKFWNGNEKTRADFSSSNLGESLAVTQGNSLLPVSSPVGPKQKIVRELKVVITAYSSTPSQTDSTPYITAAGTAVREGIVASNLLSFGTKIKIPELYGDRIFVVEDRMNPKKGYYHIDIWFPDYFQAKSFGAKKSYIEILES